MAPSSALLVSPSPIVPAVALAVVEAAVGLVVVAISIALQTDAHYDHKTSHQRHSCKRMW
jgi:hypothetical protein